MNREIRIEPMVPDLCPDPVLQLGRVKVFTLYQGGSLLEYNNFVNIWDILNSDTFQLDTMYFSLAFLL